jgi:hypothetical protein
MSMTLLRSFMSLLATRQAYFGGGKAAHHNIRTLNRVVYPDNFVCTLAFALGNPSAVNAAPHLPICSRYSSAPRLFNLRHIWSKFLGRFNHEFSLLATSVAGHDAATDREASLSFLITLGLKGKLSKESNIFVTILLRVPTGDHSCAKAPISVSVGVKRENNNN